MKKAQTSVYIIAGSILLLGIILLFFAVKPKSEKDDINTVPIITFIEGCIENTLTDAIELITIRGGYYSPEYFITAEFGDVALGYDISNKFVNIEELETQLSDYVDAELETCINKFNQSKNIEELTQPKSQVKIQEKTVIIKTKYPIQLKSSAQTKTINEFTVRLNIPLYELHNKTSEIIKLNAENPDIVQTTIDKPYSVSYILHDEDSYIYIVQEPTTTINNHALQFLTAIQHNVLPAKILGQDERTAEVGKLYREELQISNPQNRKLSYSDDTPMFEIQNGIIEFTPSIAGTFDTTIRITDDYGNQDQKLLRFIIT